MFEREMKLDTFCHCLATSTALLLSFCTASAALDSPAQFPPQASSPGTGLAQRYSRLPMSFEPNEGQTDPRVQFLSRGRGYALLLTSTEAVISLRDGRKGRASRSKPAQLAVRMSLEGATPGIQAQGLNELAGTVNYFVGSDPKKWRSGISTYAKVKYPEIYPGIDLVYYGNQQELEFDFIVAPGADPRLIALSFEGADRLEVGWQGELSLHLGGRVIQWHKPVVYQEANGRREEISCRYVFDEQGLVGFDVAAYDPARPLIIDPVMVYSTFLGGGGLDVAECIAVNSAGNAFVCGETASINFPTRFPVDAAANGLSDVFVTRLGTNGGGLAFSTYLGGSADEVGLAIAVDRNNLVYVAGQTSSGNFPRLNAYQNTLSGELDGFVLKLGASGSNLLYSTYFGGSGFESANGIAVDAGGNAYVVGETDSGQGFPRKNPFQNNSGGFLDAFVARFNTAVSGSASLVYASWLGGRDDERANGVALDGATNVYVCGEIFTPEVDVSGFPTQNAVQPEFGGGFTDGFVAKISSGSSPSVLFSSFLGGTNEDAAFAIDLDTAGNLYVTGSTISPDFPTRNAMQPIIGGGGDFFTHDAFVTKLNGAGSEVLYSTFLGGTLDEEGFGIAVDTSGIVYVAGSTDSDDFPITLGADQPSYGEGASDGFVSKFNPAVPGPSALIYSTFLGGIDRDLVEGLALDGSDNFYVTGQTSSDDFPVKAGSFQTNHAGGFSDGFITKFSSPRDLSIATTTTPENGVLGSNLTYTIKVNNNGRAQFSAVVLTDPLPTSLTYVTHSTTRGNCTYNSTNRTLTCNFGIMASNVSATVTLVTRTPQPGVATNIIRLTATETENNRGNNTNIVITPILGMPDVTLTQTASPEPVIVGSNLTYRLEVRNKGPALARAVVLTNRLPVTAGIVAIPEYCFAISNTVVCLLGNMADGASNIVEITVTNRIPGTIISIANVTTFDFDPVPSNNVVRTTNIVFARDIDLSISGAVAPSPVPLGSELTYTLVVSNHSSVNAMSVMVTNTLPQTVTFISAQTTLGACNATPAGIVSCALGTLSHGASATINIRGRATVEGAIANTATVSSGQPDTNLMNNTASTVVTVVPSDDVSIAIRVEGTNAVLSWPTSAGAFELQSTTSLDPSINWQLVTDVPTVIDGQNVVTQRFSETMQFYRLIK